MSSDSCRRLHTNLCQKLRTLFFGFAAPATRRALQNSHCPSCLRSQWCEVSHPTRPALYDNDTNLQDYGFQPGLPQQATSRKQHGHSLGVATRANTQLTHTKHFQPCKSTVSLQCFGHATQTKHCKYRGISMQEASERVGAENTAPTGVCGMRPTRLSVNTDAHDRPGENIQGAQRDIAESPRDPEPLLRFFCRGLDAFVTFHWQNNVNKL